MSRIIGLSAGNRGGSAEILLKLALQAAQSSGATVDLVRVDDLNLSLGPGAPANDDAQWFWDQLMDSDGIIVSTPIYARTVPGKLRLLGDKISGPQADVAFTSEILRMRAAGEQLSVDFQVDERVLRPRVAGFIAVGGSIPDYWKSFALPLMHSLTESAQIGVVDQVQFAGAGSPSSIVLQPDALERASLLGRNVAAQAGRQFSDVVYRGEPGTCPICHLDVIVLKGANRIECATCGALGSLVANGESVEVVFTAEGLTQSVMSMREKIAHFEEVQATAASHALRREEIIHSAASINEWDATLTPQS
jgi:multimeric flavodoxin WrbA